MVVAGRLVIVCGLPGSGKTTRSTALARRIPGSVWLNADDWMTRLGVNLWDGAFRGRVEGLQWGLAQELLAVGLTVIVDWGSWGRAEREQLRDGARAVGAAVELHYLDVSDEELWRRISTRGLEDPPIGRDSIGEWRRVFERPLAEELTLYDAVDTPTGGDGGC